MVQSSFRVVSSISERGLDLNILASIFAKSLNTATISPMRLSGPYPVICFSCVLIDPRLIEPFECSLVRHGDGDQNLPKAQREKASCLKSLSLFV